MAEATTGRDGLASSPGLVLVVESTPHQAESSVQLLRQGLLGPYQPLGDTYDGPILERCQQQRVAALVLGSPSDNGRGFELLGQLQAQLGDRCPPMIVIDANDANLAKRALRAGAADYLVRQQVTAAVLAQALGSVLAPSGTPRPPWPPPSPAPPLAQPSGDGLALHPPIFDAVLASITDFVYVFDRQGRFVFVNQPWLDLWQLSLAQVIGKTFHDFNYPPDLATRLLQLIDQVFTSGQRRQDEIPCISPTGPSGIYAYRFTPLQDAQGTVQQVLGTARDITARKRTEVALRESESRFRSTTDVIPNMIWGIDLAGRIEFFNQQWSRYTGAADASMTADGAMGYIHPDDRTLSVQVFREAQRTGQAFMVEHRLRSAAGSYRWFLVRAEPYRQGAGQEGLRWFGTSVDIHDRKLAEAALRASEAKYRSLFNSMDDGFCILQLIFDADDRPMDYRYLEINPVFEQQTGLKNALGKTIRELVPDIEPFWFDIYGTVALTGEPICLEDHARSMGRWFDVSAFRIGEPWERKVAVLFSDITRRKQAEDQLRRAAEMDAFRVALADGLRTLADPLAVQITACRLLGESLHLNRVFYCEYSCKDDETTLNGIIHQDYWADGGTSIGGSYCADDFPTLLASMAQGQTLVLPNATTAPRLSPQEQAGLQRLGIAALVAVPLVKGRRLVATFTASQAVPHDWTPLEIALIQETAERTWAAVERAQAEAAVAADLRDTQRLRDLGARLISEDNIQVLYDEILAAAVALLGADAGSFRMLDEASQELVLLTAQGLNRALTEAFYRVKAHSPTPCGQALSSGNRTFMDLKSAATEGRSGFLHLHLEAGYRTAQSTPLLSRSGQPLGMVSTYWQRPHRPTERELRFLDLLARQATDLIEQRRAEADRRQLLKREQAARAAAEQANRSKDEFLTILSHELRSPLNPILGWSKLLQTKTLDAARTQQAIAIIERNAKLQTQLIDDLLDVARILRGKLSLEEAPVSLNSVIEAAIEVVGTAAAAKAIGIHTDLADMGRVWGDGGRLQQIIWNLLANAIKFTPQGGQVTVRLATVDDRAQVTIRDTGKGIKPGFLRQIFEPFRQEDASITRHYGGLGLGLSIVKYLAEAHGGTITAASPGPGQGATFTLKLPLLQEAALPAVLSSLPAIEIDLGSVTVLAVDDSPDTRELLIELLSHYGARVKVVASGYELLAHFASFKPDILVCDIGLPGLDGYTLLQQIRSLPDHQGGQIPAIAVTAFAAEDDQRRALDSGFQRHIAKPIEPQTLALTIAELVDSKPVA